MRHSQTQAIKLIQHLEHQFAGAYFNCHFALGGSTIMKGESDKDFDVFVYPHIGEFTQAEDIVKALSKQWTLNACNVEGQTVNWNQTSSSPDKVYACWTTPKGYRVDMFFLSNTRIPVLDEDCPF